MANAARSVRVTSYIQSNVAISRRSLIGPTIFWRRTIDQLYRAYTKTPNARGSCVRRTVVRQSRGDLQRPSSATSHPPPPPPPPPLPRPAHMPQRVHDARCQLLLVYSPTTSSSTHPATALIRLAATVLGLESLTVKHSATFASSTTLPEPSLRLAPAGPLPPWAPAWCFGLTLGCVRARKTTKESECVCVRARACA